MALVDAAVLKVPKTVLFTVDSPEENVSTYEANLFKQTGTASPQIATWDSREPDGVGGTFTFNPPGQQIMIVVLTVVAHAATNMTAHFAFTPATVGPADYDLNVPPGLSTFEWTFQKSTGA